MSNEMIGKKFVLWREEFRKKAYKDQFGVPHEAYVVLEQIPVTVSEVKEVPDMWSDKIYEGWKAVSEAGEEFTCNCHRFPSDSMTPTYYWDAREDSRGLWQPVDACQAYGMGFVFVMEDGKQAYPVGADICDKHHRAFIGGECYRCKYNLSGVAK